MLRTVSTIIVHTKEMADGYLKTFPFLAPHQVVVTGKGVDLEQYLATSPEPGDRSMFRVVYTGIFYPSIQRPEAFFDGFAAFAKTRQDVRAIIVGNVQQYYQDYVQRLGLGNIVEFLGHQPHDRVIALQKGATVLLVMGVAKGYQLSSKLVEYYAAQRPILVISPDETDIAARMVASDRRGIAAPAEPQRVYQCLEHLYCLWQKGVLEQQFDLTPPVDYSWERVVDMVEQALLAASSQVICAHTRSA